MSSLVTMKWPLNAAVDALVSATRARVSARLVVVNDRNISRSGLVYPRGGGVRDFQAFPRRSVYPLCI